MRVPLVLCDLCHCHVRFDETRCPHCGSPREARSAKEGPARVLSTAPAGAASRGLGDVDPAASGGGALYYTRRAVFVAALVGLGNACGGQVAGEDGNAQQATQADIVGACGSAPSGTVCSNARDSTLSDGGLGCRCGPAGDCYGPEAAGAMKGGCVPWSCPGGAYLSKTGQCVSPYWYQGPNGPTVGGCYGAPPLPA